MRIESIAKKVSCTVVKTSLLYCAGDISVAAEAGNEALTRPWPEHCQPKPVVPMVEINLPKRIGDMAGKLTEFGPQGRLPKRATKCCLDYYA
jgi:hypothetical protein